MEISDKLTILADAAKYDASCASSGGKGKHEASSHSGLGVRSSSGICHSWTADGRCVSLLKVLYSNVCKYDCAYCVNRASSDIKRASFTPEELVNLTIEFYKRNYIEGLFLSSGIFADPDIVMEQLIKTARKLRLEAGYGGYIHMKIIPGSGENLIKEAGFWADRLSANIELPTEKSLNILAPQKSGKEILGAMDYISKSDNQFKEDRKKIRKVPQFAPAGQSTQLIVGASSEDDRQIISLSGALYKKFGLKRVYYSAFMPVGKPGHAGVSDTRLPEVSSPPLVREHRLYQADWLMRFYYFKPDEILDQQTPYLDTQLDPKTVWALNHASFFPVELKTADYELLLRVPGIGALSAKRIIQLRRSRNLTLENVKALGVVMKRAKFFITVGGSFIDKPDNPERIRHILIFNEESGQLPLFNF